MVKRIQGCVANIVSSAESRDADGLLRWHTNLLGVLGEHNKEEQILPRASTTYWTMATARR